MGAAIRSEFRKFFTTRMWWGMAIGVFLSAAVFGGGFGFLYTSDAIQQQGAPTGDATQVANSVYTAGLGVGYLLLLTIGIMQIGSEYRHKTISGTFLATPKRVEALLAKAVALLGIGALYGLLEPGRVDVGRCPRPQPARGRRVPSAQIARTAALSLLVLGLWALIGLGAGILIPNQVAALLISVGVAWIVEPLAGFALGFWSLAATTSSPTCRARRRTRSSTRCRARRNEVRLRGGPARWSSRRGPSHWPASASGAPSARTCPEISPRDRHAGRAAAATGERAPRHRRAHGPLGAPLGRCPVGRQAARSGHPCGIQVPGDRLD